MRDFIYSCSYCPICKHRPLTTDISVQFTHKTFLHSATYTKQDLSFQFLRTMEDEYTISAPLPSSFKISKSNDFIFNSTHSIPNRATISSYCPFFCYELEAQSFQFNKDTLVKLRLEEFQIDKYLIINNYITSITRIYLQGAIPAKIITDYKPIYNFRLSNPLQIKEKIDSSLLLL